MELIRATYFDIRPRAMMINGMMIKTMIANRKSISQKLKKILNMNLF